MNKAFWGYFFSMVGTISSIVTLISFVFQWVDPCPCKIALYTIVIVFVSFGYASWQTSRPNSKTLTISNTLSVNIAPGDIFKKTGNGNYVVIPVNEYFDTLVNDTVVSASSLHGMFVERYYKDNHGKLHEEIENYFKTQGIEGKHVKRENSEGYKVQYPLGTCALIHKEDTTYVLMALTHFDDDDHAYVELSEFGRSISRLCHTMEKVVNTKPVYMPLMGMGLSRLNQPAQFILKYTLDTIAAIKGLAIPGGVNIVIYEPLMKTLNLNEIEY